ncbi:M20/M25/M40 family metallo-hydrolase [Candidatus Magnetominusculus dajiuhuensis]|uniref:M20/M25/M40 family metallo-hydrolase n=1 Tax=Candidatus Magnetominusculus dajiuhuensis TaxID=3137712 RepID=UPI003B428B25
MKDNTIVDPWRCINPARLMDIFIELVQIDSPSYNEREIASRLTKHLIELGLSVEFQQYGKSFNLIGRKHGKLRGVAPVMLSSHMDTVESTKGLKSIREGGVVKTDGGTILGADDKSGIAEILEALYVLKEQGLPHGDIEVVLTSAEERGLIGAQNLNFDSLKSRIALVLDCSGGIGRVVLAAPTHDIYEMHITGRAAHAGIEPERGTSAIKAAANIIAAVPDGRIDPNTTANIGTIQGGTATNIVPKEVTITGEIRSHDADAMQRTKNAIFDTARRLAKKNQVKIEIRENRQYHGFHISEADEFVGLIKNVCEDLLITPEFISYGGGSDANIYNRNGIKSLVISSGMQMPHTTDEYIKEEDLSKAALMLLGIIKALAADSKM